MLNAAGAAARDCFSAETKKIALVSNPKVFGLYGETVQASLEKAGFEVFVWLMKDGEKHKNLRSAEAALKFFSRHRIKRTDAVVALGGGVVGDLAGFAASIYLRGIDFLLIPTTLLSMIDSSVGGKTGVNTEFGKNLVGAFHQPRGVLIDVETIRTLARREVTAGFCEAIKQGSMAGRELFDLTAAFLEKYSPNQFRKFFSDRQFLADFENLISAQVAFKADIVSQDEREDTSRTDRKSRKILNFGHTLAHALETVTEYKRFKHGEAVGYGILFAGELAKELAIFSQHELKSLNDVVRRAGKLPPARDLDTDLLIKTFAFDKKSIGDSLQWILLEKIGRPTVVRGREIPDTIIRKSLTKVLQQ